MPVLRALCPDMLRISLGYDARQNRITVHVEQALIWNVGGRFDRAEKGEGNQCTLERRDILHAIGDQSAHSQLPAYVQLSLNIKGNTLDMSEMRPVRWRRR